MYLEVLANRPDELIKFYREDSSFAHIEGECVSTAPSNATHDTHAHTLGFPTLRGLSDG
jgi:hypothetical protein